MRMLGLAIAGVTMAVAATPAAAVDLFVFGDSLTDSGNADAALRAQRQPTRTPAAAGYLYNRFSNGFNFADTLSLQLGAGQAQPYGYPAYLPHAPGITPGSYTYGGNNFSYGGAQTRDDGHGTPGHSPSFVDQLGFFAASGKVITPDDYVLVTFGGNDIQQELIKRNANSAYVADFTNTYAALENGLAALVGAGAKNIIVTGQADVGVIPRIRDFNKPDLVTYGTEISEDLNTGFKTRTNNLATLTGLNIQFFDLYDFQDKLLDNAAANGFTNTTDPCLNEATGVRANPTCAGYLYFDKIHPTGRAHTLIGLAIAQQIGAVPEPATWATMILGFGVVGAAMRRRRGMALAA